MKRILVLFVLVLLNVQSYSQFKDWGAKFGLRGSLLFPENEYSNLGFSGNDNLSFDWYETSVLGEVFFGVELSNYFEVLLSAGYGYYSGRAVFAEGTDYGLYKSMILPVTMTVRVSPFDLSSWNPYFFAGGGMMRYDIDKYPGIVSPVPVKSEGWVAHLPAGIGAEFFLSNELLLDFSIGGAFGSTWDLDAYSSNDNRSVWDAYLNTSLGLSFTWENCQSDVDEDGLGKCDEELRGTDPRNPDTDNDGLTDGEEYAKYKTDPLNPDTDGDGLRDGMEVLTVKTSPLIADTDKDGLNDGEEYIKYRTNPHEPDSDKDGLSDSYEVNISRSNPLAADTDKDGLSDYDEVMTYKTNPLSGDSDGDGLTDAEELLENKTDPLNKDTDGGTVNDLTEVVRGTDPLNADDDVIKMDVPIVLEGITFETGKTEITPESALVLKQVLKTLELHKDIVVQISGHTDDVGSNASNKRLSEARANAVRAWLLSKGIQGYRVIAAGYGEELPRVPNTSPENRRLNRRIEFKRIL
jgi:outer membrane protein OmpA-like peptidoglycan-associated protein